MFKLILKATGERDAETAYEGVTRPLHISGVWECGTARFMDHIGEAYEVQSVPASDEAAQLASMFEAMIDKHIDDTAKSMRYTSIHTAVSYADEPAVPQFQAEGSALRAWRSLVYAAAIQLQQDVLSGAQPMPATPAALIALLPAFTAPEV